MSECELTRAIADALGLDVREWMNGLYIINEDGTHSDVDYCNNWNDLMPLVVEHEISLLSVGDEWLVTVGNFTTPRYRHPFSKNPQRALAECLLEVLTEKAKS